jgi:hypothetical protein
MVWYMDIPEWSAPATGPCKPDRDDMTVRLWATHDGFTRNSVEAMVCAEVTRIQGEEILSSLDARAAVCGVYPESLANAWLDSAALEGRPSRLGRPATKIVDDLAARVLAIPRSERWQTAVSTALLGAWSDELWQNGRLSRATLGTLKAEARTVHRELVPLWRRRTRHGRVLSLDAALGDGLSLYDPVVSEVDYLAHTADGVFEDDRLNRVLRGLTPIERAVVFVYAEGEGTTWSEAAAHASATDPDAFGERVRRKTRRLAAEQHRRAELARTAP